MKFSITFKYSNVTFKNKENKETVTFDSKAEGNTFTFDNVDEDVVLGIVKGIKDRKASQVFAFDNLRTNFVNVIARNKCKELYDKLDKGGWKVEDVAISTATIKDLEFTKPTMNARENLTVESKKVVKESANNFKPGDIVDWFVPEDDEQYGKEFGGEIFHGGEVYKKQGDVYEVSFGEEGLFYPQGKDLEYHSENLLESRKMNESKFTDNMHKKNSDDLYELSNVVQEACREIDIISNMYDVSDTAFEKLQDVRTKLLNALPSTKTEKMMKSDVSENKGDITDLLEEAQNTSDNYVLLDEAKKYLFKAIEALNSANDNISLAGGEKHRVYKNIEKYISNIHDTIDELGSYANKVYSMSESAIENGKDKVEVEFKKTPEDGEVIAFFPETRYDGSCNPGMIMSYMHVGQHGEASVEFYNDCTTCLEEDYADLLAELEKVYDDCELIVVD